MLLLSRSNRTLVGALLAAGILGVNPGNAEEKIAPKTLEFLESTTISGYVEASYTWYPRGSSHFAYSGLAGNPHLGGGMHKQNVNSFNIDAFNLVFEKPLDESEYSAGYRVDLYAGQTGLQLSDDIFGGGFALRRAYVMARVPIGNGLDLKMGKFDTLMNFEGIDVPYNFNVSHGLLYFLTPAPHSGVIGSYKINDQIELAGGVVNGYLSGSIDENDEKGVYGKVGITPTDSTAISLMYYVGDESGPGTAWSQTFDLVASWNATEKLSLGLDALWTSQDFGAVTYRAFGAAVYAKYQFTDIWSLATRLEAVDQYGQVDDFGNPFNNDLYTATLTLGFDIWKNLKTRVEWKHDWYGGEGMPFNGDGGPFSEVDKSQDIFILSAAYLF